MEDLIEILLSSGNGVTCCPASKHEAEKRKIRMSVARKTVNTVIDNINFGGLVLIKW